MKLLKLILLVGVIYMAIQVTHTFIQNEFTHTATHIDRIEREFGL